MATMCLMPYTLEVLEYLKDKKYAMTIITNGFSEIQDLKMSGSGLQGYFDRVITSKQAGWLKPHRQIFDFAVKQADVAKSDCLMVGDNQLVDIQGAQKIGMDGVFFNPEKEETTVSPTYEVHQLTQLLDFLCRAYAYISL